MKRKRGTNSIFEFFGPYTFKKRSGLMNQNRSPRRFSPKVVLSLVLLAIAVFFLGQVSLAFLLSKIPNFENYYSFATWAVVLLLSLVVSLLSLRAPAFSLPYAALSSFLFSLLILVVGLLIGKGNFQLFPVLLRLFFFVSLSSLFVVLFTYWKGLRSSGKKKFRFSK